jgi:ligand-binding SRPBCC domain-containing protein
MTTLTNCIDIRAPREQVWETLTHLDLLAAYDPGTKASVLIGERADGIGAERRCDVQGGWFIERVTAWEPGQTLTFELVTCSFPVNSLRHDYTFTESDGLTQVSQVMTYELKYRTVGRVLDAALLRRKWDSGIKAFLAGLKQHVETAQAAGYGVDVTQRGSELPAS